RLDRPRGAPGRAGPRRRRGDARRAMVPPASRRRSGLRGHDVPDPRRFGGHDQERGVIADLGIAFGRVAFVMLFVLNLGGIMTWVERKQSAIMQDRIGANRASIFGLRLFGLFHPLADAIKMLTKEDFRPARAHRFLFGLATFA